MQDYFKTTGNEQLWLLLISLYVLIQSGNGKMKSLVTFFVL